VANGNNTGTITNSGSGNATVTVATVGSNVTGITGNSTASALSVTTLNVNAAGTTVTNSGTAILTLHTVQGNGDLVLVNNVNAAANKLQIVTAGSLNNTGNITNQGTGNSYTNIGVNIGSNVGRITQNSSGTLILSGNNTNTGGVALQSGILSLSTSTTALGATASTLTITGGQLDSSTANLTLTANNAQNWNNSFGFVGTQNLNLGNGSVTIGAFQSHRHRYGQHPDSRRRDHRQRQRIYQGWRRHARAHRQQLRNLHRHHHD